MLEPASSKAAQLETKLETDTEKSHNYFYIQMSLKNSFNRRKLIPPGQSTPLNIEQNGLVAQGILMSMHV